MPDHIYMLVRIPPKMSVASFMGYLKGRSAVIIHERHTNLKYNYGNCSFGALGYYVSTVG
ncbi:transposase IS200-family protein [Levilactobacillus brevis]|nr:transposase IS200-family protein [Levilactobacillus brevis]